MNEDASMHEHAAALLPWLVNGTLQGDERERVERHVRVCLRCRADLTEQTALRTLVRRQPAAGLAVDAHFDRMRARLEPQSSRRYRRISSRAMLAAAATLVLTVAGIMLWAGRYWTGDTIESPAPAYRLLSSDVADRALIDVIFAEGVREAEMRTLLAELGAEIVAGPSAGLGRYTLRIGAGAGDAAARDVEGLVAGLLRDERVRFAAPAYSAQAEPREPADEPIGSTGGRTPLRGRVP